MKVLQEQADERKVMRWVRESVSANMTESGVCISPIPLQAVTSIDVDTSTANNEPDGSLAMNPVKPREVPVPQLMLPTMGTDMASIEPDTSLTPRKKKKKKKKKEIERENAPSPAWDYQQGASSVIHL